MHRLLFFILFLAVLSLQAGATVFVYSHKPNETLAKAVAEAFAGQTVKTVTPDELVTLRGEGGDVLAVIGSQYFPKNAFPALEAFLDGGNHYLGISGLPFTEPLQKLGEKWLTAGEINAAAAGLKTGVLAPLSEMGAGDFILNSSEGRPDVALEPEDGMLHITAPRVAEWQTYTLKRINQTDIDDDSFITFSAKGSLRSPAVWIFLQEKDGSRWNKKIELKNSVAEYALRADDFTYWQDSRSKGRGLDGDRLHLSQLDLAEISIMAGPKGEGVSLMDTVIGDPADIYISDICYFKTESGSSDASVPDMHCIYPAYEMHETEGGLLKDQAGNTSEGYARIASPLWRNRGYGTGYEGPFRQVPLATLYSGDEMRGIAAEAVYNYDRDKNNVYVYIGNDEKYLEKHPGYTARILKAAAKRLTGAPFIARGGVREFSVAPGEKPALGMTVRSGIKTGCKAEVSLTDENGGVLFSRSRALDCAPGEDFSFEYKGPALKKGFFTAVCRLYGENGELLDLLEMPFSVYAPEKRTAFNSVTRRGGDFWLKGQKWVPYGINYWPSYAAGLPPHEFFDLTWQHPWQYDPAIIERDFDMLDKMGINCISFGLNHGAPMRDVCMRAEKHGIKLHIATGGTHPLGLNFDTIKETVGSMGIARSSAVFSYDLGWEVHVGGYETRQRYNEKWTRWITDNYGSRENAFEDWGFTPPADKRDSSLLDGPTDGQITGKEPASTAFIAAYRRFMDETISKGYQYSVRELRKYDPLTLMGARSGYGGTGAEGVAAVMPFDLKAGVRHLDYTAPEAYNIGADRAGFLRGHLNNVYGRFVSGGKPVMWPEYGSPLFYYGGGVNRDNYRPGAGYSRLANEAAYYAGMADFIIETKANGALGWWFPGGYRVDEMSDFGITNHDGTLRPAGAMIMEKSPLIVKGFEKEEREKEVFEIDRDLYASGYAGLFTEFSPRIADSFMRGKEPVLKTAATGTTTATVPRVAVGNTPFREGKNPIKYLSSEFDFVRLGKTEVIESAEITLPKGKDPVLECRVANTDEPLWLAAPGPGRVSLSVTAGGRTEYYPIKRDTATFEAADFKGIKLAGEPEEVTLRMWCEGVGGFGETVRLRLTYK